jgi:intracellular multiplication protein IcmO
MARYKQRGLDLRHEQDQLQLIRDTRTLGQRFTAFLSDSLSVAILFVFMAIANVIFPEVSDFLLLIAIVIFFYTYTRKATLPFRMPQVSGAPDFNDPLPGSNKPRKARGIAYLGNDRETSEELWFTNDDMRTHLLIFGSTGSGKTEALVSFAFNALVQASGFIYVDGKGDNSLYAKVFAMTRKMGREDDMLLINFMTGARDVFGPQEKRLSNTLNPFALGSSSMLAQLVVSMMDGSSKGGDGDMWKGRAISFVDALMKILVYMRDAGYVLLDANSIRQYFHLPKLEEIVIDKQFPREGRESVSLEGIPEVVLEPLANFLLTLPGYDKSRKGKQNTQTLEQHGYITMQLTRVFTSLADTYGHILRVNRAEVDLKDVVLNRRILVVLLPALEKAPDELSNLGKIIVTTLKAMMSSGLGSDVEGTYRELIQRKPTNAETPFMCILDEYGYYAVEGFAVVPAQARSLGFSAIFAGQDLPAFQKASKEEAASIGANTNIKIAMKLEDPVETWDFFNKTAGESYVTKVDSFQTKQDSLFNNYADAKSASAEKRARIDLLDLKEQREGEYHIFFKSKIIRGRAFFANPPPLKMMRLNHHLRVDAPTEKKLLEFEARQQKFIRALSQLETLPERFKSDEDLTFIFDIFDQNPKNPLIETGVNALVAYFNKNVLPELEEETDDLPYSQLNLFTPLRLSDPTVPMLIGHEFEKFSMPLVKRNDVKLKIEFIEKIAGKSTKEAVIIAKNLLKDIEIATLYPPDDVEKYHIENLPEITRGLAAKILKISTEKNQFNNFEDDFL